MFSMSGNRCALSVFSILVLSSASAYAQTAVPSSDPQIPATAGPATANTNATPSTPKSALNAPIKFGSYTVTGSLRARYENWNWFSTPGFNDSYGFAGVLGRVSIAKATPKLDVLAEVAVPVLLGLPNNAIAPAPQGQLGLGASYRAASGGQDSSIFPKQVYARFKFDGGKSSLRLGRFEFMDGSETVPASPTLAALKRDRINQRVIGTFGFSHVGRSFDGAQYQFKDKSGGVANIMAFRPTEGVFQLNGLGEVADVDAAYASYTKPLKNADARLFALYYRDGRAAPQSVKTDNRPLAARQVDSENIGITTLGAHYIGQFKQFDVLGWGALQSGNWGTLSHRANALAFEAGYQPKRSKLKPWLRLGYFRSSGDGDNTDNRHGTWFSVLPTPRVYARTPFFNQMNNEDLFAEVILRPTTKLSIRSDAHKLNLSNNRDLWYAGGGAFSDAGFGFAGRPSGGNNSLGNLFDISLDYNLSSQQTLSLYFGHAQGGDVIDTIYAGNKLNYAFAEFTQKF